MSAGLEGCRVLVVEDEILVSMLVEDILTDIGCSVVGPVPRLEAAIETAQTAEIDIALLDVNLAGARVFPVADILAARGLPFIFMSGYGESALEEGHKGRPVLEKPFNPEAIEEKLREVLGR